MAAFTNINAIGNPTCYWLAFLYDSTSAVNASYVNCGDLTPMTVSSTAGTAASAVYIVVSGIPSSVVLTSGILSAGNQVGGYGQTYVPWVQAVTTVPQSALVVPTLSSNYLG